MSNARPRLTPLPSAASLLRSAREAGAASYSPYSGFRVGAAVLAGGKIYQGTNIENASYGLTMCAERVAIFSAISAGHKMIDSMAIACLDVGPEDSERLRFPCGACRQVLAEFGNSNMSVLLDGWGTTTLGELLPLPFNLKK
jgi:cytidine deaminase